jgi:hypothetical protein
MGREVDVSHQRLGVAISLQSGRDVLHVLSLTRTLGSETHEFAARIDDAFSLSHTTLCIVCVHRCHRLYTNGVLATYTYLADMGLTANSPIHIYDFSWS